MDIYTNWEFTGNEAILYRIECYNIGLLILKQVLVHESLCTGHFPAPQKNTYKGKKRKSIFI